MADRTTAPLMALLDEERAALLRGDYVGLERLAPAKEKLLARLPDQVLTQGHMHRVAHAVRRNQALLAAAIDGMRSAKGNMAKLREQRASFSTYDKSGLRQTVGGTGSVIERKA